MRFQPAVDEHKEAGHLCPLQDVALDDALYLLLSLLAAFGIAVAGEVYQIPLLVDEEVVDEHGLAGSGRGHGQSFAPSQHIDETGFSYVGPSDEGVFGQVSCRAFLYVSVADDEFSVRYFHLLLFYVRVPDVSNLLQS